jgi:hypothetical protein
MGVEATMSRLLQHGSANLVGMIKAWCPPAAASDLLLPMAVEVVPSHVVVVLFPFLRQSPRSGWPRRIFFIVRRR